MDGWTYIIIDRLIDWLIVPGCDPDRRDRYWPEAAGQGQPDHLHPREVGRPEPEVEAAEERAEHQSVRGGRAAAPRRGGGARPRDSLLQVQNFKFNTVNQYLISPKQNGFYVL